MGTFKVQFRNQIKALDLIVVKESYSSLLEVELLEPLGIGVYGLNQVSADPDLERVCKDFAVIFNGTLGQYKGPLITFSLDPKIWLIKVPAQRVPLALKPWVDTGSSRAC